MSFNRKIKRRSLAPSFAPYSFPKRKEVKGEWFEYDDIEFVDWERSDYTQIKEAIDRGRNKTYTSEEMFYMSKEEREKIVRSAITENSGMEYGLFKEDVDDEADGIWGFCEGNKLIIRGHFGDVLQEDGCKRSYYEAYLVENRRVHRKGLMGVVYFPFSKLEEGTRLVVLDMELKKAS